MSADDGPNPVRKFTYRPPVDLVFVAALTATTCFFVLAPGFDGFVLGVLLGIPFVLFAPGYAVVSALFPEAGERPSEAETTAVTDEAGGQTGTRAARRIDGFERVVLSLGTSIAVVPLAALLLNFTPLGVRPVPVVFSVGGLTIVCAVVGAIRRQRLPPGERFSVPYRRWLRNTRETAFGPGTRSDRIATVAVALAVVLTLGSVAYTAAVPRGGETFSELYLLTEDEDGDLVATDYPTEFVRNESAQLYVGVENREREPVNYTVVVELQQVRIANDDNGSARVTDERELHRFDTRLAHNESWQREHTITPRLTGERLRVAYLLYRGQPPADPTVENAYREVHIWIDVSNSTS